MRIIRCLIGGVLSCSRFSSPDRDSLRRRCLRIGSIVVLAVLLLCSLQVGFANSHIPGLIPYTGSQPVPTQWMSPERTAKPVHEVPQYFGPLIMTDCSPPQVIHGMHPSPALAANGRVAIVVHASVFGSVMSSINLFAMDLQAVGFSTTIYRFTGGTPEALREYLAGLYRSPEGLKGAIFVGDIPYVIYELMQDWDGPGGAPAEYDDFPCDLFYMDLDGEWLDTLSEGSVKPNNGKYDTRSGNLDLEIWVGRIRTHNMSDIGSEAALTNSYFARNRAYRAGTSTTDLQAVVYDDDDWRDMLGGDLRAVKRVFPANSVVGVNDPDETTAADFKNRLPVSTRWYLVRSHGYPGGHGFYRADKSIFDYVTTSDYCRIDPHASFYSFFVCSGCDYTTKNFLGGIAAYNPQADGIFAIGSTKTGGMWNDNSFYVPMGQGNCIGESFRIWFNEVQYSDIAPAWWYGMVMIGDPTLHPNPANPVPYYTLDMNVVPAMSGTVTPPLGVCVYPSGVSIPVSAAPTAGYSFVRWDGPVDDPYSANTSVILTEATSLTAVFAQTTIDQAKMMGTDMMVSLANKPVTVVGADFFYIEEPNRTCGIRVYAPYHSLQPGMTAQVSGRVSVNNNTGERFISAISLSKDGYGAVYPLALNCRSVGGADWHYDSETGQGQRGVTGGEGTNNIGLLVTVCGKVSSVNTNQRSFFISDGSTMPSGSLVKVLAPAIVQLPDEQQFVSVVGVVSCQKDGENVFPIIRMIGAATPR